MSASGVMNVDPLLRQRLMQGANTLGVGLSESACDDLLAYLELMARWNKVVNLTAIQEPAELVTRHILDSLAVLPYLAAGRIVDVGTGAGLPGIPLTIVSGRPITLLDRSHKRMGFLTEAVARLALSRVDLQCARVEDFRPKELYDVVLTRAFASLADVVKSTAHLLAPHGVILAMKGARPTEEITTVVAPFVVRATHELMVPGLDARRHVVEVVRL